MLEDKSLTSKTPSWFNKSIEADSISHMVNVTGVSIHYRLWGQDSTEKPGIVFVHGASANSHWWDFIAPEFIENYRVLAIDCAGAGDSDHKEAYPLDETAAEIMAVCRDSGFDEQTFLVAHSFGYFLALQTTLHFKGKFRGLIGIDPPIKPDPVTIDGINERSEQIFATRSEAVRKFQINKPGQIPHQSKNDFIVDYISLKSIKLTETGWTWKVDPNWAKNSSMDGGIVPDYTKLKQEMGCPLAFLLGKNSAFYNVKIEQGCRALVGRKNVVTIEDAGHHVHIDQPQQFIKGVKEILARW